MISGQVGEHLLAARKADIEEENDSNSLVAQLRPLAQRAVNSGAAMLSVINDEARRHWNVQQEPVLLHPNMAAYYREQVAALAEALTAEENRAEAADLLRSLVDRIELDASIYLAPTRRS